MTKEYWKPIPDYEGIYEISNHGHVRSVDRYLPYKNTDKKVLRKGKLRKLEQLMMVIYVLLYKRMVKLKSFLFID